MSIQMQPKQNNKSDEESKQQHKNSTCIMASRKNDRSVHCC